MVATIESCFWFVWLFWKPSTYLNPVGIVSIICEAYVIAAD